MFFKTFFPHAFAPNRELQTAGEGAEHHQRGKRPPEHLFLALSRTVSCFARESSRNLSPKLSRGIRLSRRLSRTPSSDSWSPCWVVEHPRKPACQRGALGSLKSEILLNRKAFAFNMFQSSFQKVTFHIMFKTASGTSNRVVALTRLASLDRSAECARDPRVEELLK